MRIHIKSLHAMWLQLWYCLTTYAVLYTAKEKSRVMRCIEWLDWFGVRVHKTYLCARKMYIHLRDRKDVVQLNPAFGLRADDVYDPDREFANEVDDVAEALGQTIDATVTWVFCMIVGILFATSDSFMRLLVNQMLHVSLLCFVFRMSTKWYGL